MSQKQPAAPDADPYFPTHGDTRYRIHRYELDLAYRPASNRLSGTARLGGVAVRGPLREFALDLADFRLTRVKVDGRNAHYTHRGGKLRIRPAEVLEADAAFTVEVHYTGNPVPVRSHWGGLGWEELSDGALVASQPIGAPSWYPCNDRPGDKASYQVSLTAPSPYTVVVGGRLLTRTTRAGTTTWVYEQSAPTSSYLVGVSVGRYETVRLGDRIPSPDARRPVRQTAYVPARLVREFTTDFARQPQMMEFFADVFGPYPFDEYAVVVADEELDVPVEAQGLATFGANHLGGRRAWERLVAHELAHQWFGNSLTVADWRHIWLSEGFAKYAEWLWSEHVRGPSAQKLAARAYADLQRRPQDLRPADPGRRMMFDDRLYERGGLAVHAVRCALGDGPFFRMLKSWTATHRHGLVTTDAFAAHAQQYTGRPIGPVVDAWVRQPALPPPAVAGQAGGPQDFLP